MKFMSSLPTTTFLLIVLLVLLESLTFTAVVDAAVVDVCPSLESSLPLDVTCSRCKTSADPAHGFRVALNCTVGDQLCFRIVTGAKLCTPELTLTGKYFQKKGKSKSVFTGTTKAIKVLGTTIPSQELVITATHPAPLDLVNPFAFKSCAVNISDTVCADCTICDYGEVKFDCTNVVIATLPVIGDVTFPSVTKCIGLKY